MIRGIRGSITEPIVKSLIVCDGNSLTLGTGTSSPTTQGYPAQLATLLRDYGVRVVQFGINGQTSINMESDAARQVDTLFFPNEYNHHILIAWEIINTLAANYTPTEAVEYFKTYCLSRKTAGWTVIALTMIPATETGNITEANRVEANNLIKDPDLLGVYWDYVVDVGSDSRLNGNYVDVFHLNITGYGYIAEDVSTTIIPLLN